MKDLTVFLVFVLIMLFPIKMILHLIYMQARKEETGYQSSGKLGSMGSLLSSAWSAVMFPILEDHSNSIRLNNLKKWVNMCVYTFYGVVVFILLMNAFVK